MYVHMYVLSLRWLRPLQCSATAFIIAAGLNGSQCSCSMAIFICHILHVSCTHVCTLKYIHMHVYKYMYLNIYMYYMNKRNEFLYVAFFCSFY